MKNLSVKEVLIIHDKSIKLHGGTPGVKDINLIESSLNSGLATFGGEDLYHTTIDKISMISYSLIKNHGFEDGNKRVGCAVLYVLCHKNNINFKPTNNDFTMLGLGIAAGELSKDDIKKFIIINIR